MPLFRSRKVSKDEAQRRLENRLVVAKESPETVFDMSDCGMTELPKDVFSLCRVLRKEAVLLNDNDLSNLKGGGSLKDLADVKALDLRNNRLTTLPSDLDQLKALQVLNVQSNKLKALPRALGGLSSLQTLNVKGNNLHSLPDEIGNLKYLKTLNVTDNPKLAALPASLAYCRLLENIMIDDDNITIPPREITKQGTVAILKYLSQCAGIEYVPSSREVLKAMDTSRSGVKKKEGDDNPVDNLVADALCRHDAEKESKLKQMMDLEQQIMDINMEHEVLANRATQSHDDLVDKIRKAEAEMDDEILWEQNKQDAKRHNFTSVLAADEQLESDTVAMILQINERAHNRETILDDLEKERIKTEHLIKVTREESDRLRKEEVLASMARLLESRQNQDRLIREYETTRDYAMKEAMQSERETSSRVLDMLNEQYDDRETLKKQISIEELAQMQAIQALQLQKDAKHRRLRGQISMLQDELAQLTLLELDKRDERQDTERIAMTARREGITSLMSQLVDEQRKREGELMKRLLEMEDERVKGVEDYWLIQFQRLLDSKPQSLLEKECDAVIAEVLAEAEAQDYAALFARHRINWEMLKTMGDSELREMGIRELGVRKAILKVVEARDRVNEQAILKEKEIEKPQEPGPSHLLPSAPPAVPVLEGSVTYSECVVCMDRQSDVVLLDCGHVCCCFNCSSSIRDCPICRQPISQLVRIYFT